jgi:hypothetical protein
MDFHVFTIRFPQLQGKEEATADESQRHRRDSKELIVMLAAQQSPPGVEVLFSNW